MIHYICKYTPIELFAGFGAECIRREPLVSGFELADGASHQNLCAFSRALLEDCLQNGTGELILVNCCDSIRRVYDILQEKGDSPFLYLLDLPRCDTACARKRFALELKRLAAVGLVGFPNVGKSTLLSVVSKAHPKIANYHFTTLYPNLGVVYVDEGVSFVMADIPGIIEGASEGAGLGHDFLRHIDRCRLLVHLVDVSGSEGRDPIADFDAINQELRQYSPELADRPQIVVANKTDLLADPAQLDAFRAHVEEAGYTFMAMSAATHQGTRELVQAIAARLAELPPVAVYEPEYVPRPPQIDTSEPLNIQQEDNTWLVEGPWLQRLMANINFSDYESRMYFDKMLRQSGLFDQLERMGIQDGDIVSMYNLEFEYQR